MSCGYFNDREDNFLWTDISSFKQSSEKFNGCSDNEIFDQLMSSGYRRSGDKFYRTACSGCNECQPIRIHVSDFHPSKSQRYSISKNSDVNVAIDCNFENYFSDEKIELFSKYFLHHNPHEFMPESLAALQLLQMNCGYNGCVNMDYREKSTGRLIACGIVDVGSNCLSSNYFYYDVSDDVLKRSIGVFSVLKEIELCLKLGLEYEYLGLYIKNCRKMNYKSNYKPYQLLVDGEWVTQTC